MKKYVLKFRKHWVKINLRKNHSFVWSLVSSDLKEYKGGRHDANHHLLLNKLQVIEVSFLSLSFLSSFLRMCSLRSFFVILTTYYDINWLC